MADAQTPKQQINAELAARSLNTKAKRILEKQLIPKHQSNMLIDFFCECSDAKCQARVPLTLEAFEKLHKNKAQFVLLKGHEEPKIESTVKKSANIAVVEKYALKKSI